MPVASVHIRDRGPSGPRQLYAPKEASARGWWNEIRRTFPNYNFQPWSQMQEPRKFEVSDEVIMFESGVDVRVMIARKRNMR
jgi:hypothetical protein